MTIGTSLFHALNMQSFSKLDGKIAQLQTDISAGVNDPRPSNDLVRATRLSAVRDQDALLSRFEANLKRADARLSLSDQTLEGVGQIMQRLTEIGTRSASTTLGASERGAMRVEVLELRGQLINLANSADDTGRALFAGHRNVQAAFVEDAQGRVHYMGDGGQARLQVSESARVNTGLNGADVFFSVPDTRPDRPAKSVFEVVDDLIFTLSPEGSDLREEVTMQDRLGVALDLRATPEAWSFTLEGPIGAMQFDLRLSQAMPSVAVDAINAQTLQTGITARLDVDGQSLILEADGALALSGLEVSPARRGVLARGIDAEGRNTPLVGPDKSAPQILGALREGIAHFADARAEVGALGAVVDSQADLISARRQGLDLAISGLEDLDLAAAITQLQQLMLGRDAMQQTYVKITRSTLFDYLR